MDREWIFRILVIVGNLAILYIIGAFIAWDVNPINWWLFTSIFGRIIFAFLFITNLVVNLDDKLWIMYKEERDKIFKKLGWIVECESPYEIYHEESNSSASGMAEEIVEQELIANRKDYLDE